MDIAELIKSAKIGRERKDAQIDSCSAFAAALYDVLEENGYSPSLVNASYRGATIERTWHHLVVEVDGTMYDSLGEFSTEIMRARSKIHPTVSYELKYSPEIRDDCYDEDDFGGVYEFLVKEFRKTAKKLNVLEEKAVPALAMR
ncbi:hypothetical protein [Rhizobium sp. BK176]|uniref:hypothetical protein n=1 Tax=Rhizobium sp. BK176 TaxID=2587071 RepID=UPI00216A26CA|nr:hypothetical protein [Rhizobium sp. BK176]MCS4088577.1 DNA-binding LacI/PurR family transcriptional regulator [Rhizobium sp. BK176]